MVGILSCAEDEAAPARLQGAKAEMSIRNPFPHHRKTRDGIHTDLISRVPRFLPDSEGDRKSNFCASFFLHWWGGVAYTKNVPLIGEHPSRVLSFQPLRTFWATPIDSCESLCGFRALFGADCLLR